MLGLTHVYEHISGLLALDEGFLYGGVDVAGGGIAPTKVIVNGILCAHNLDGSIIETHPMT